MSKSNSKDKTVAQNRKARHDYFILDSFECGIVLTGTEIKSVRNGNLNLKDSYASLENGELWLFGMHISPYEKGTYYNHEPERDRKLLMHKHELIRLKSKTQEKGLTLVPLSVYIKDGRRAKVELGLAKGRTAHDKRDMIADREAKRDIARAVRGKGRYEDDQPLSTEANAFQKMGATGFDGAMEDLKEQAGESL